MPLYAIFLALSVGAEPSASPKDASIKLYDTVGVSTEQIRDVKAKARQAFPGEIERIYVDELRRPLPNRGFRVDFKSEIVKTYVIERQFFLEIIPKGREKGPVPHELVTSVKRLFPLKTAQLRLYLSDELSYRQAMALLQTIESRTYRVRPDEPKTEVHLNQPINVSAVVRLHVNEDARAIEAWINDGQIFAFRVRPDGFELVRANKWIP